MRLIGSSDDEMKNRDRLIDAICTTYDKAWLDNQPYYPRNGETFCNFAIQDVAHAMGCDELANRMANDIYDFMNASPTWSKIPMLNAQGLANNGTLIIAAQKANGHGHVSVVRPGLAKWSAKWNVSVPAVMNIGKDCFISKGVNFSFEDVPDFFVWKDSL